MSASSKQNSWSIWDTVDLTSSGNPKLNILNLLESEKGEEKLKNLARALDVDDKYNDVEIEITPES